MSKLAEKVARCSVGRRGFARVRSVDSGRYQDHGDGSLRGQGDQLIEKLAHAAGVDRGGVHHRNDLFSHGIKRPQHVETLPA